MTPETTKPVERAAVIDNLLGKSDDELGEALGAALRRSTRLARHIQVSAQTRAALRALRGASDRCADEGLFLAGPAPFPAAPDARPAPGGAP